MVSNNSLPFRRQVVQWLGLGSECRGIRGKVTTGFCAIDLAGGGGDVEAIYGRTGRVVAWVEPEREVVRDLSGSVVAYLMDDMVVTIGGRPVGWLSDGWFRDGSGYAIGFTSDSQGGPTRPVRSVRPVRPVRGVRPVRPLRPVQPVRPALSLSWSSQEWEGWIFLRWRPTCSSPRFRATAPRWSLTHNIGQARDEPLPARMRIVVTGRSLGRPTYPPL